LTDLPDGAKVTLFSATIGQSELLKTESVTIRDYSRPWKRVVLDYYRNNVNFTATDELDYFPYLRKDYTNQDTLYFKLTKENYKIKDTDLIESSTGNRYGRNCYAHRRVDWLRNCYNYNRGNCCGTSVPCLMYEGGGGGNHIWDYDESDESDKTFSVELGVIPDDSQVTCSFTYQINLPAETKFQNNEKILKSIRVQIPNDVQPSDISNMLKNVSKNNRPVRKTDNGENGIEVNAKFVKNKMAKKSKHQKNRKFNNDLEYDLSDYYNGY